MYSKHPTTKHQPDILCSHWKICLQEAIAQFKENMVYEMMSIDGNKGHVPSIFIHTID
jgi:hypothetical protein